MSFSLSILVLYVYKVIKLFKSVSISDGTAANSEIKISIQNIDPDGKEFDVVVRQFGDVDSKPSILEAFTKCNMDPSTNNFVGRRIGTADGEFTLNSKFIMLVLNPNASVFGVDTYLAPAPLPFNVKPANLSNSA